MHHKLYTPIVYQLLGLDSLGVNRGSDVLGVAPVVLPHKYGGDSADSDGNYCEEEF